MNQVGFDIATELYTPSPLPERQSLYEVGWKLVEIESVTESVGLRETAAEQSSRRLEIATARGEGTGGRR